MSRTAAFVFFAGNRFYGTVIAYVPGQMAASHKFTSALPVQIFRHLSPILLPLMEERTPKPPSVEAVLTSRAAAKP